MFLLCSFLSTSGKKRTKETPLKRRGGSKIRERKTIKNEVDLPNFSPILLS